MSSRIAIFRRQKPTFLVSIITGVAVLACMAAVALLAQKEPQPDPEIFKRLVRYSFTLENRRNEVLENVAFRAFAPVKVTPFQRVERIETSISHQVEIDALGNQTLVFNWDTFPPYGQKIVSISVWLTTADEPAFETSLSHSDFLAPLISSTNQNLHRALQSISDDRDEAQWVRSANHWVYHTLEDVGYVAEDRGAQYALQEEKGDCTEFAHALMALVRSKDIPAIFVAGFPVQGRNSVLQPSDYHNWVLVNAGEQWRVADPHVGGFETEQERYIAFRLLQSEPSSDMNSQRFFSYDSRIRARMN